MQKLSLNDDELSALGDELMRLSNMTGIEDFEGYNPTEMEEILYQPLSFKCPVRLRKLTPETYHQIPMYNLVSYLLNRINDEKKVKLTITGRLPVKWVADLYHQGYYKDEAIEKGFRKLYNEERSMSIHLAHILLQGSPWIRKSHGYLQLTKAGQKVLDHPDEILRTLFYTLGQRFNKSYFDGYEDNPIGTLGWCFVLALLKKYGSEERRASFYSEKYFRAFPTLLEGMVPREASSCMSVRIFERFFDFFGIIECAGKTWMDGLKVRTTPLFSELFEIDSPKHKQKALFN